MDPSRTVKYALDRVFAFVLLLLSSPLFGLIALAVRLDSPGSPFFLQERIGARGQPFTIFKFRTMRNGAERDGLGVTTAPDDERITRLGSFLRRTGLDELPQLLNILLGEMSFVGPRPTLRYQVDAYTPRQRRRLLFRPGITGWAQVHGRNDISWAERIELDLEYVRTHTLGLDLGILMRTLGVVLRGRGIYAAGGSNDGFLPAGTDGPLPAHDSLLQAGDTPPVASAPGDDDFLATDSEGRVLRLGADGTLQPASTSPRSSRTPAPTRRDPVTSAAVPPAASSSTPMRADRDEMQSAPMHAERDEMQSTSVRAERGTMQSAAVGGEESEAPRSPAPLPRWVEPVRTPRRPLAHDAVEAGSPSRTEPAAPLLVVGAGGHARVVIDAVEKEGRFTIAGVLDDAASPGTEFLGYRILGGREVVEQRETPRRAVVAIGAAAARGAWIAHLASLGYELPAIVHPSAAVGRGVELGAGTVLLAGAVVNTGARLGRGVIVNTSASVDHDCVLADLVHVAPGARLAGNVRVGERAHLGIGACVIQGLEIGADVIVGAGAAVVNAIPAGTTVVGVPARPVRTPPPAPPAAPASPTPAISQLPRA
ncbi:MAG TPA: NeuD/PglB/VioB family sugar acetyltransferase [Candidatus Krumholzibacteria bacterium]|nr:NeuD/PglB/VioB family sugar acetyltransferase [Candidatus Krumholzibacteria bacterium]